MRRAIGTTVASSLLVSTLYCGAPASSQPLVKGDMDPSPARRPRFLNAYEGETSGLTRPRWRWAPSSSRDRAGDWLVCPSWDCTVSSIPDSCGQRTQGRSGCVLVPSHVRDFQADCDLSAGSYSLSVSAITPAGTGPPATDWVTLCPYNTPGCFGNSDPIGLTALEPIDPRTGTGLIWDLVGARYRMAVVENESRSVNPCAVDKLVFGTTRLHSETRETALLIERNVYTYGIRYADRTCGQYPPCTDRIHEGEASLRLAMADYQGCDAIGTKTDSVTMFPRQTYLIDINGPYKTDMVSQTNLTGKIVDITIECPAAGPGDCPVTIVPGATDADGWNFCPRDKDKQFTGCPPTAKCDCRDDPVVEAGQCPAYPHNLIANLDKPLPSPAAIWRVEAAMVGGSYKTWFAVPQAIGKRVMFEVFATEFYQYPGAYRIAIWDLQVRRVGSTAWEPIHVWRCQHKGPYNVDFGFKKGRFRGRDVVELTAGLPGRYLQAGATLDLRRSMRP